MVDAERIEALERRVAALESLESQRGSSTGSVPADDERDHTFWALDGLRTRAPEPGAVMMVGSVRTPKGHHAHWQVAEEAGELFASDFADRADSLAALAHPVRLRMLQRILTDADTVRDLADTGEFGTSGQIYHHLRQLTAHGWLRAIGGGRYEVPAARVVPLLAILLGVDR